MHESHHNSWDISKRKPRRFRNTPANKYGHFIAGGFVLTFALVCHLYTEADWVKPHKERFLKLTERTPEEEEKRLMMSSYFLGSAIRNLHARTELKEKGAYIISDVPPGPPEKYAS